MSKRLTLEVRSHFDAAHHLPTHPGKCSRVHGHRWEVLVGIQTGASRMDLDSHFGMVVDFGLIKDVISLLDHRDLNVIMEHPTAENIAWWLHDRICSTVDLDWVAMIAVTVWESPDCSCTVEGDRDE